MDISNDIKQKAVKYSVDSIKHICESIGPRESGMPAEHECQKWLKGELDKNQWVDSSVIEPFKMARYGLLSFAPVIGTLMVIASLIQILSFIFNIPILKIVANIVTISFSLLSLLIGVLQFLFYKQFLDVFLPKLESHNLIGVIKPQETVKRRIVIGGHTDSAYEFTIMKIHQNVMVAVIAIDIIFVLIGIVLSAISIARGNNNSLLDIIIFSFSALLYLSFFFLFNFKYVVPGANDNLTGTMVAMGVAKCLKESGIKLKNTEVQVLLTGSEEAGLRGANAWSKKYKPIYDAEGVETVFLAFDSMRDYDWMTIYYRDMSGIVENSPRAVKLMDKAAKKLGIAVPHGIVPAGASDAAAVSKNGMHAVAIAAQNPHGAPYYHNRRDTADNLDPKTMALGLDLALAAVEVFDEEGLPD